MGTPFIGEIRMFGGNFAPVGWALCAGQNLQIAQNDALYSLIGTTYGGDGPDHVEIAGPARARPRCTRGPTRPPARHTPSASRPAPSR